jgi:hypothetical protein
VNVFYFKIIVFVVLISQSSFAGFGFGNPVASVTTILMFLQRFLPNYREPTPAEVQAPVVVQVTPAAPAVPQVPASSPVLAVSQDLGAPRGNRQVAPSRTTQRVRIGAYVRIPVSGEQNNCFFNALNEAGVEIDRPSAVQHLLRALSRTNHRQWIANEVEAAMLTGEYTPAQPNLADDDLLRDYILNHLGAPESDDGFNMVGFSPDRPGVIDVIADVLGIRLRIININGRVIREADSTSRREYTVNLLHHQNHFYN